MSSSCYRYIHIYKIHTDQAHIARQPDSPPPPPVQKPRGGFDTWLGTSSDKPMIYLIFDDRDRLWADRMKWVIGWRRKHGRDDLHKVERDFKQRLKSDQRHIQSLQEQLERARKQLRTLR